MRKLWMNVLIAAAALVVLAVALIPFFVDADTFRPRIQQELSLALGREVTLGHIGLSLFTGSLVASDISIADDPAYSSALFLRAKELRLHVHLGPLVFHRSLEITALTIDSPSIQLIHAANGTWNFSSLGGASSQNVSGRPGALPSLTVSELKIRNGSAALSSLPTTGNPLQCSEVDLVVKQLSFTHPFPIELSLKMPGGGSLSLKGTAGPITQADTSLTPFQATLNMKHFDPVAAGAIEPGTGISLLADLAARAESKDGFLTSTGKITATQLKLARHGSPARKPVDIDFRLSDNLSSRTGQVNDLAIHTGAVAARIRGSFRHDGVEPLLDLHLSAPQLPVDSLEELLPSAGITLPSGSRLKGGTLTASLAITGPANAAIIAGPIELDNSQLEGFDLGSRIQGMNPLGGSANGTEIQKLSAEVVNSPKGTNFTSIDVEVPRIGSATGEGTVSPAGDLNFQLSAKIAAFSAVDGVMTNTVDNLFGKSSKRTTNSGGIPLTVAGTASSPSIRADLGKMLKQAAGGLGSNAQKQVKLLKGLFHK